MKINSIIHKISDSVLVHEDEEEIMLTTLDNPFNPFTQWIEWFNFDHSKGYNTSSLLARFSKTSDDEFLLEYRTDIEAAMNEVLEINPFGLHIKVTPSSWKDRSKTFNT